ncbi:MAG: flagellar basal-body MS-ring/collar protein FliF [Campylobacterota bacterium]|nr:flagellar basal-body MS-ring/collar protein FliF [Campylobacterota bacterium]
MDFKVLFSQLVALYSKLTSAQKMVIGGAVSSIVAFLIFLVVYTSKESSRNDYQVLFDSLSSSDAAKVVEKLEKDGITYKIVNDNVIEVPRDVVYKQRIEIASMGIPKDSGVGFELFDKQEFGATSFDQSVKYLRALEGELTRTISALSPVDNSSVNLAIPKESLFVSKQVDPSASVMVQLNPNRTLSHKQIRGIKNLVAAAVSKLIPENVTLINSDGETLGDEDETMVMSELSGMQQKFKSLEEKKKEAKIVNVLAPFIGGKDRVVAKVTIEFDFSQQSSTSETFDPDSVVRSEQALEEKREGSTPATTGGVPGAVSNIGPVQGMESGKSQDKYTKNSSTTNYEISKTVSTIKGQFSKIKRITAAVTVDGKYRNVKDADGNVLDDVEYVALDESQLSAISSLVKQSIGINEERGDKIAVHNLQFESTKSMLKGEDPVSKASSIADTYVMPFLPLLKYLLVAIILFVGYRKIVMPFAQRMLEVTKEEDIYEKPHLDFDDEEDEDLVEKAQQMRKKVEDQLGVNENYSEDELKHDVLLEKVKTIVEEKPEDLASIFHALIQEELSGGNEIARPPKEDS